MATREDIVRIALAEDGYHDGLGYDEVNKYAESFGIDYPVAYCDIFVAWVFTQAGVPLPNMHGVGLNLASGAQYCPDSWAYAQAHNATTVSWLAQPGDQVIFNWDGDGNPLGPDSHTELVQLYDASTGWLYTVGGNSGPSNVDGFRGTGGVHRHAWYCPAGIGNDLIQGVIDTSKLVTFSTVEDDFILTPEDKTFLTQNFASKTDVSQLVKVFEDGANHAFGMEGIKDVDAKISTTNANVALLANTVAKIAAHLGVQL